MWISNKHFLLKDEEFPVIPIEFSQEAKEWWTQQKKLVIEGKHVNQGEFTKWMPPNLYFHVNFWRIALNKNENSKSKSMGRPFLRDIEWEIFTAFALARGLSGFENINIPPNLSTEEKMQWLWQIPHKDPGSPLYNNEASDLLLLSSRDWGKTEICASIIFHEFTFNGAKKYYSPGTSSEKTVSEITVGAGAVGYTNTLFTKFKYGYDALSQMGIEFGGKVYPHPFIQKYDGALTSGKMIIAQYKKKVGGEWRYFGSKSKIRHVAYGDNPYAAQGTRNSLMIKEEIGEFPNLIQCQENDLETMKNGNRKSGTCIYCGTGGNMTSGTLGAYKMFYAPETYNLLVFKDKWENKGNIGMFIPGTKRYLKFKDEEGRTNERIAYDFEVQEREKIKKSKNSKAALLKHIQYNPLVPSEIFLRSVGNIFPVQDLATVLADLETDEKKAWKYTVDLFWDDKGKVQWKPNTKLEPIENFPLSEEDSKEGCIVIYEPPPIYYDSAPIPYQRYIAAHDPIAHGDSKESVSLACTMILDTYTNKIVAEYSSKQPNQTIIYENVRKLLHLYNARCLYENAYKGLFDYMEFKSELHLLLPTPSYLKDVLPNTRVDRGYGMHFDPNGAMRADGEKKAYAWLTQSTQNPDEPNRQVLHNLRCIPLLKELLKYDSGETNTDRVDVLLILMIYLRQIQKTRQEETQENYTPPYMSSFFSQPLFPHR